MKLNKIKLLFLTAILLFAFNGLVFADDLDGWMTNNNDGTYAVKIENDNGDTYTGTAVPNPDGTYSLNVEDRDGDVYTGTATKNPLGDFVLDLNDETYGGYATGSADVTN